MQQPDKQDNIAKAQMLLATRRFLKLDEWLLSQMRGWQNQTEAGNAYGLIMHPDTLFSKDENAHQRLEILNDWVQQCPTSYHVHCLMGMFWHEQAWVIRRGKGPEHEVEDSQWLGAQLCCDYAVLSFLNAIACHPRPTHAFRHMMNLAGGFGEPYWLRALFVGQSPKPLHEQFNIKDSPVWHQGAAYLYELGVAPATHWPQQLPSALQQTRRDQEDALDYWLRMAMSVRHSDVGSMESYLLFHSSYWGGGEEQQNQIIEGPMCAEFSDDERNQFRANALLDALAGEIADRESPRAEKLQQQLTALLAQPLEPATRIALLNLAGTCIAYWQDDDSAGLQVYAELFAVAPDAMPGKFAALFISRAVLANEQLQGLSVLTSLLVRAINRADDPLLTAFAAAAVNYGLYGLPCDPALSNGLMDCAWALMKQQQSTESVSKDLLVLAHDMAINDDLDATHFLMTEMARRGSAIHSYELFFFYRNAWHQDVPEALHNDSNALDCVLSAARSGLVPAMFSCANALREGLGGEVDYQQAMQWYQRASDAGHPSADYWRASCALDLGPDADKRQAVEIDLPAILAQTSHSERFEAAYTLGMAYMQGIGCKKNKYIAWQLMNFVLELNPESDVARHALTQLEGSLRARMSLWQDKRKVDGADFTAPYRLSKAPTLPDEESVTQQAD